MYNKLWNTTYKELKTKLKRKPSTREVQLEMLHKMFGTKEIGHKNETSKT